MSKTMTRRQAAKSLNTTAGTLRQLEESGIAAPLKDQRRRARYTPEMVAELRGVVQPPPVIPPLVPQETAPSTLSPPAMSGYEPAPRSLTDYEIQSLGSGLVELLGGEAAAQGLNLLEFLRKWTQIGLVPPLPPQAVAFLGQYAAVSGHSPEQLWASAWSTIASEFAAQALPAPTPTYSGSAYGYQSPAPAPPLAQRYAPSSYPLPMASQPFRAAFSPPQRPATYCSPPWPSYSPPQYQPPPDPVRDVRNQLEIERIELERRRLERLAEAEEEARQRAEEQEAARAVELERARALAAAQFQSDAQQRKAATEAQQRLAQQQLAAQVDAVRRQEEAQRRQQQEVEEVEKTVAQTIAKLPAFLPYDAAEAIRQSIWSAVSGKPSSVVGLIAQDIADRAVAPYLAQQQTMAARQRVTDSVVGLEKLAYAVLGTEAMATAESAVRAFVDSGAVDGTDHIVATIEARRVRDAALEPFRQAAEAQKIAQQIEHAIQAHSFGARSRAAELLRAAGVDDRAAVESVLARAVELTRERTAELDPSAGMFAINQQVGELLLMAAEEAAGEIAS